MIAIAVFLVAFGIAFAMTVYQATITLDSGVQVEVTVVISGDNFSLWHDAAMTKPVTGDLSLSWDIVKTQSPLPGRSIDSREWIYIQNDSDLRGTPKYARPLAPCQRLIRESDGVDIGSIHANMFAADSQGNFWMWRGDACDSNWPKEYVMAPGEKWLMELHPHFDDFDLFNGLNRFPLVVGGILWIPDTASMSPAGASAGSAPGDHPEP